MFVERERARARASKRERERAGERAGEKERESYTLRGFINWPYATTESSQKTDDYAMHGPNMCLLACCSATALCRLSVNP